MGIRDVLDSTVNGVKTPITYAWQSSYGLGSVAVTKINNAVRGGGNGVNNNDENKQLIMKKETNNEEFKPSSSSSSSSGSPDHQVVVIVGQEKIGGGERQMGGFRDVLGSAASVVGGVKTPVSNALKNSHSLGSAAVSKIDNTVRVGGGNGVEKLKEYMPGPEGQEKIGRALTHPATKELFKLVVPPGGVGVYNVVAAVLKNQSSTNAHDNKKYEQVMEQLKLLRDENDKMRADLEHIKEFEYSPSKLNSSTTPRVRFKSLSTVEQKPEEVVSVFMMKGLKVRDFMDVQVVPPIRGPIDRE